MAAPAIAVNLHLSLLLTWVCYMYVSSVGDSNPSWFTVGALCCVCHGVKSAAAAAGVGVSLSHTCVCEAPPPLQAQVHSSLAEGLVTAASQACTAVLARAHSPHAPCDRFPMQRRVCCSPPPCGASCCCARAVHAGCLRLCDPGCWLVLCGWKVWFSVQRVLFPPESCCCWVAAVVGRITVVCWQVCGRCTTCMCVCGHMLPGPPRALIERPGAQAPCSFYCIAHLTSLALVTACIRHH